MEKRTILAFILSFLVLLTWSFLYQPKQEPMVPEDEGIHEKSAQTIPEPVKPPDLKPSISPETDQIKSEMITPGIKEKEIRVETPLYKAIFSNAGATIKSFQLKEYFLTMEHDSPLIEMAHPKDGIKDYFKADFSYQSNPRDKDITYSVNEESIHLDTGSAPRDLTFSHIRSDGVSIDQVFRFYPDTYDIDLIIKLTNRLGYQIEGNITAYLQNLPPDKKSSYYAFNGVALLLNDKLEKLKPKDLKEETYHSGRIDWVAYEDDYFISAIIPEDQSNGRFMGQLLPSGIIKAAYITPTVALRPLEQISSRFTLFMGPRDVDILKQLDKKLDKAINFGFFDIIARPLHFTLRLFNRYVHNYGISIIILTILIKILFWPLTHKSYKSMKEMQKLQPLMAKIREKYKNNKGQMQKELMGLYKTYKVNPMGGCLPMVIQIPVFFALFRILGNSIELRHAPFLFWINDLSAPDRLFNFPFNIPFMSPPYGIPVLTLLMGASMFIQQKMTPTPGDPAQAKMMMFLPVIFTVMFINFPSGLVLYWLTNNILSIGQQYRIKKGPA